MHPKLAAELGERAAALKALGADREKRLAAYANIAQRGLDDDAGDLLNGAYLRWLGSDVAIVGPDETFRFLIGAINSLRSNGFRRKRTIKRAFGERLEPEVDTEDDPDDPVDTIPANTASPEETAFAQQLYDQLSGDPDLQLLLLHLVDRTPREVIKRELGWDDKKYDAVQKRKTRMAAKLRSEGKV